MSRVCKRCLRAFKRSRAGRRAIRAAGSWRKFRAQSAPSLWVYHSGPEKLCERHIVARRVDGANRRGAELRALPSWADKERIAAVYREARYVEKLTGKPQHVDHIIPLKGRKVCGLHVAENLQVLSAQENARKGNRYSA